MAAEKVGIETTYERNICKYDVAYKLVPDAHATAVDQARRQVSR